MKFQRKTDLLFFDLSDFIFVKVLYDHEIGKSKTGKGEKMAKLQEMKFKVAGVTFDNEDGENRQNVMKRLAKMLREEYDKDELFDATTKKEQIEYEIDEISEFENVDVPLSLHHATYQGDRALRIKTEAGFVGFVPAKLVEKVLALPNAKAYGEITGGRVRILDIDEVTNETYDYGMNVTILTQIPD